MDQQQKKEKILKNLQSVLYGKISDNAINKRNINNDQLVNDKIFEDPLVKFKDANADFDQEEFKKDVKALAQSIRDKRNKFVKNKRQKLLREMKANMKAKE